MIYKRIVTIKLLLITFDILRDKCLAQPALEKLLPAAGGNKCTDLQPDLMQNERAWNTQL